MTDPKWPISKATDTPDTDEAEVTGHLLKGKAVEQPADDPDAEGEVKGHGRRPPAIEQPGVDPEVEVEGHGYRHGAVEQPGNEVEAEVEVEGHLRIKAVEQPTDDVDPDAGDTELAARGRI